MEITKYDILATRIAKAEKQIAIWRSQIENPAPLGAPCGGCGEILETESDFAKHFVIGASAQLQDTLNLGECPHTDKGKAIIAWAAKA